MVLRDLKVSLRHRRAILAEQRVKDRLENIGVRAAVPVLKDIRKAAIRDFRKGENPSNVVRPRLMLLQPVLTDALAAAHLSGVIRVRDAADTFMRRKARRFGVYDETIAGLAERARMTDEAIADIRETYGKIAFTVVDDAGAAAERAIQRTMLNIRSEQLNKKDALDRFEQSIMRNGVLRPRSSVVETLYRTQTQMGYSVGRQRANEDPLIDEILWGYEYFTVGDDRVRPSHVGLDRMRAKKDDPIWNRVMPPNGWACRCTVVEIFKGEAEARIRSPRKVKFKEEIISPGPDRGFDFNPSDVFFRTSDGGPSRPLPVPISFTATVSTGFKAVVESEVAKLPADVVEKLGDKGVEIRGGSLLTEVDPKLIGKHPPGWRPGASWDWVEGYHFHGDQVVGLAEKTKVRGVVRHVKRERMRHTLSHEIGHAVDANLAAKGRLSSSVRFAEARAADISHLTDSQKNDLAYFLQDGARGRFETFAEGFAATLENSSPQFTAAFPRTIQYIKSIMEALP